MTQTQRKLEVPMMMTLQVQDVQVLVTFFDKYFVENFCFGILCYFGFMKGHPMPSRDERKAAELERIFQKMTRDEQKKRSRREGTTEITGTIKG